MNEIRAGKRFFYTPATWDELSARQLLVWAEYCLLDKEKLQDMYLRKVAFAELDTVLKFFIARNTNRIQRAQIGWTVAFLTGDITLSKILIKHVECRQRIYHGPSDKLNNISVEEFATADKHASDFLKKNNTEFLDKLIATLYRQRKKGAVDNDDVREEFNYHQVDKNARILSRLHPKVKHAIFLQYAGCRALIVKRFPLVFTQANAHKAKNYGWPAVMMDMAGPKLGTVEKVEHMRLWNLLHVMQMNEDRRITMERKAS